MRFLLQDYCDLMMENVRYDIARGWQTHFPLLTSCAVLLSSYY